MNGFGMLVCHACVSTTFVCMHLGHAACVYESFNMWGNREFRLCMLCRATARVQHQQDCYYKCRNP